VIDSQGGRVEKVRRNLWYNERLGMHTASSGIRPSRVEIADGVEVEYHELPGPDTYGEIGKGAARHKLLLDVPNGSQFHYSDTPEAVYRKENDVWVERVSGLKTGRTVTVGSMDPELKQAEWINMYLPNGQKVEDVIDESLFGYGFDSKTYDGSADFSDYNYETSKFNPGSNISRGMGTKGMGQEPIAIVDGKEFRLGQQIWASDGTYLGKVDLISKRSYGDEFGVENAADDIFEPSTKDNKVWYNAESVKRMGLRATDSPAPNPDVEIKSYEVRTVSQIVKALKAKYPGVSFNFTGLDVRSAEEYAETMDKLLTKYPQLRHSLNRVNADDFRDFRAMAVSTNRRGSYASRSVSMNTKDWRRSTAVEGMARGSKTKWFNNIPSGREIEYLMSHEIGHALDYLTNNIDEARMLEIVSDVLGRKVDKNDAKLRKELLDKNMVSEYSTRNPDTMYNTERVYDINVVELVAESFADVEINGVNAKEISKRIHKELIDKLREY
jgi:hypothetical protein